MLLHVYWIKDSEKIHNGLIDWARTEYAHIMKSSEQAIYIYVCDRHRIANDRFISMLGYESQSEWEAKDEMLSDVKEEDQDTLVTAYQNAIENKVGSSFSISWMNIKNDSYVETNVILVPLSYKGTLFAIHFITEI